MPAALAIAAVGLLVGGVIAFFGGGGSVLAVPVLVHLFDRTAQQATTITLLVVGAASFAGTIAHARADRVRWQTGGALAAGGVVGSAGGSALSTVVGGELLLVLFSLVMLGAAWAMWVDSASTGGRAPGIGWQRGLKIAAAGVGAGFVTGFFGIGGGFVLVPLMVMLFDVPTPVAVGTSVMVITVNAVAGLALRLPSTSVDWTIVAPFAAAAVVAALAGERLLAHVDADWLTRAFAVGLVAVALYTGIDAGLSLV